MQIRGYMIRLLAAMWGINPKTLRFNVIYTDDTDVTDVVSNICEQYG